MQEEGDFQELKSSSFLFFSVTEIILFPVLPFTVFFCIFAA